MYIPTPSFPGNFKMSQNEVAGEIVSEKIIWKLQRCGKIKCLICPLLNCSSVVKSNFTNRKYSILTDRNID